MVTIQTSPATQGDSYGFEVVGHNGSDDQWANGQLVVTLYGRPDRGITGTLLDLAADLG